MTLNVYVEQRNPRRQSREKIRRQFEQKNFSFLMATNQLSICWKGKRYVRSCCEKKQR